MSQCGVSVPVGDIADAVIKDHLTDIAIALKPEFDKYVLKQDGNAESLTINNASLTGSLMADTGVVDSLCMLMHDCISATVKEELGCDRDNHTVKFEIDQANNQLVNELKFGEKFTISHDEFITWLGVKDTDNRVAEFSIDKENDQLFIRLMEGERFNISRSELENWLQLQNANDKDTYVASGELVGRTTLRLTRNDDTNVEIDLRGLSSDSPFIESGELVERVETGVTKYYLVFHRSDGHNIEIDLTEIFKKIAEKIFTEVMKTGYTINTQAEDYTLTTADFNGRTIIRANKAGDMTVTITKPATEEFIGRSIIIRKTAGKAGTFTTLVAGEGVTLTPDDATLVRRVGSAVTLVYVGEGVYDLYGELP